MSAPLRLTDEELVLLGGEHPVVELPFLGSLDVDQRSLAVTIAYRALFARGAVAADGSIEVPEHILDLLAGRSAGHEVLAMTGTDLRSEVWTARYLHRLDGMWLVEDVATDGVHEFAAVQQDALEQTVREWVEPLEPIAAQGDPVPVSRLAEPWGRVRFKLDISLVVMPAERGRLVGVLGGDLGTWLTDVDPATPGEIELEPTDLNRIVARVLALLPPDIDQPAATDTTASRLSVGGTMTG